MLEGFDADALAAARANTGSVGQGFPFLGEDLAARRCLPGRGRRWLWRGAVLAGYAPFAALEIVLAPPATRVIALVAATIAPVVLSLVTGAVARPLWQRWLAREDLEPVEVPGLRPALAPAGLREVKVFCDPRGRFTRRSRGAARRFGRVGVIFLRPSLKKAHPDLTRFITAHEAAHLARDDVTSQGLAVACLATLVGLAAATRPTDVLWLYVPASALIVALRWCQELACDRIAANAAGPNPAREYIAHLGRADARRRLLPFLPRLRAQLRDLLTHPPRRMRRNALARTIAKTPSVLRRGAQTAPSQVRDAEDVVQETLPAAWRGLSGFEEPSSVLSATVWWGGSGCRRRWSNGVGGAGPGRALRAYGGVGGARRGCGSGSISARYPGR
jgi:hypothetical protein